MQGLGYKKPLPMAEALALYAILFPRQQNGQHGFLHMQAVLGFVEDLVGVLAILLAGK